MNNQIINFTFEAQTVRTATNPQGEIYFCLPDVANVLEISRSSDLLQVQKDFVKNETPKKRGMLDPKGVARLSTPTKGGTQQITFISEPNLYRVIFRSNKAEAVKFQNWVFDEVLPSIRKTGQYRHTISAEQQAQIQQAIKTKCQHNKVHYQTLYHALYQAFSIPRYSELLACDFERALAFIWGFEFTPSLNTAFIANILADNAHQIKQAQDEFWGVMGDFRNVLEHLDKLQHCLEKSERCIQALQKQLI